MKRKFYLSIFLIASISTTAQIPEEALRLSWLTTNGSARNQAIGGAMVSLGGDISANHINPAGLAFFRTSDLVLTPAYRFGKDKGVFRGSSVTNDQFKNFSLGTTGVVIGGIGSGYNTAAVAFSVTRTADFKDDIYYKGQNNYSSFAEALADEFASSGLTIDQALNSSNISLQTKLALYTYLVDTARVNGNLQVIARSENPTNRDQQQQIMTSGGITEFTLGMGGSVGRKFMLGASLGVPVISMDRRSIYHESDATGNTDNDFNFLTYDEQVSLRGVGVNVRLGVIYRPKDYVRLGLAVHSPNMMWLKETFKSGLATDVEQLFNPQPGYDTAESYIFTGGDLVNKYSQYSTARIAISGSYVFREVADVRNQKGFITADIEYTNYKWAKFAPYREDDGNEEFFDPYNEAIDAIYKGAFNFKVGGELKFKTVMARAGFAYYGNPYAQSGVKGRKMNISGGLGYRNKGFFADLTYVHRLNKDTHFPYRVNAPRSNTFATIKESGGGVLLTLGFKI